MVNSLDEYYLSRQEPNRSCLLSLRSIIAGLDSNISESLKYGAPCFSYKKKMFCYLWVEKKSDSPYILMVEGKLLNHPKLEQGDRKRMKIFRINPNNDLPIKDIHAVLQEALALYKERYN